MTRDDFEFTLKRCGCRYLNGQVYYEENELLKCFEDVGAFEVQESDAEGMKITIYIPQSDIPEKQDIISVDIHFFHGKVCECTYPFEVEYNEETN